MIDGESYGLNKGLIGVGSDNARGYYDNISAQIQPPNFTLDTTENFTDNIADLFTGATSGTWSASAGRYSGSSTATPPIAYDMVDLGIGRGLSTDSYLELTTDLKGGASGGRQ